MDEEFLEQLHESQCLYNNTSQQIKNKIDAMIENAISVSDAIKIIKNIGNIIKELEALDNE